MEHKEIKKSNNKLMLGFSTDPIRFYLKTPIAFLFCNDAKIEMNAGKNLFNFSFISLLNDTPIKIKISKEQKTNGLFVNGMSFLCGSDYKFSVRKIQKHLLFSLTRKLNILGNWEITAGMSPSSIIPFMRLSGGKDFVVKIFDRNNQKDTKTHTNIKNKIVDFLITKYFAIGKSNIFSNFIKSSILRLRYMDAGVSFFSKIRTGVLVGKAHQVDGFILGKNLRAYKKDEISPETKGHASPGRSFIETRTELRGRIQRLEIFTHLDAGFCSKKSDLFNTIKSAFISAMLSDPPKAFGASAGFGIGYIMGSKKQNRARITCSIPLIGKRKGFMFNFDVE